MHRLLRQRRWLRAVAAVLLFTVACVLLSDWQWHRRSSRLAAIALVQANYDREPVPLARLLPAPGAPLPEGRTWTPVLASGAYAPEEQLLVRHRPHGDDGFGYQVLVPLRLDGGGVLLVDRGWVPPSGDDLDPAPVPAPPAGRVTVVARLLPGEPVDGRAAPPGQVQAVDLAQAVPAGIAAAGSTPAERRAAADDAAGLLRGGYGQLVAERPSPAALPLPALAPSLDEGPHLGYAVQWILFAVAAWAFLVVHLRRAAYEEDVAAGRRAPRAELAVPDPRRRRSDEEVEDAALDAAEVRAALEAARRSEALAASGRARELPPEP